MNNEATDSADQAAPVWVPPVIRNGPNKRDRVATQADVDQMQCELRRLRSIVDGVKYALDTP